jgi:biotin carboxylase
MSLLILHKKNESRRRHLARAREYARQHGERLVLAMTDPTWEADFADQVVIADIRSVEQTLAAAGELAGGGDPISAVASFAEAAVPTVATLAVELDLPAVSERTAYLARDKFAMRQAFAAAGVPQPGFALARTLREARVAARRTGFPVVLKPVLGTGSMYVRSVADEAELDDIFALLLQRAWDSFTGDPLYQQARREHDGALLIEEFVPGPEVCVDSLVVDGETHVIAIHDKPLPTGPTFEEVYACTPTRLPGEVAARVGEATKAAARMGGGPVYRSVLLSTGVDLVAAALDLASGRRPDPSWRHAPRPVGFWNMFPERPGQFTRVQGLEEVNADSQVDEIAIYRQLGDYLAMPPATIQGHGHLIFTVDTVEQLDDAFERYRKTVRLETRAG